MATSPEDIEERRRRVVAMTKCGMTASQIATALHVTSRTVVRDRNATGCTLPNPAVDNPLRPDELRRAEAMLDEGCSFAEIARTLGRSPSPIGRRFRGRGWTRQQRAEYISVLRRFRALEASA